MHCEDNAGITTFYLPVKYSGCSIVQKGIHSAKDLRIPLEIS
jgi:hypothetical protein